MIDTKEEKSVDVKDVEKPGRSGISRKLLIAGLSVLMVLGGLATANAREIRRLWKVVNLFKADQITENFRGMTGFFPYNTVHRGGPVFKFGQESLPLPKTFSYQGKQYDLETYLRDTWTTGLIVIKNDKIAYEKYFRGNTADSLCISWSVNKSFVSALFGIAISEGLIGGVEEPVTKYAPELKGTGYDGVRIKDVLQMSSGVGFNEDYGDFYSDINRMGRVMALGFSINEFVGSLKRTRKPGTYNHYVSMDTQVLGMILKNVTKRPLAEYLEDRIWKKIGMKSDARWLVDDMGMELAFGTMNVTLEDYARFGRLYLNQGNWNGEQIVPAAWVRDSITPDAPHLMPGKTKFSSSRLGYGYQWWIPEQPQGDFMAAGIYNQYIYVNPAKGIIVAKTTANYNFTKDGGLSKYLHLALFQAIAEKL